MSEPTAQQPTSSPSNYSPSVRLDWVWRHRRLLFAVALSIGIAIPICWFWQPLKHRALWNYWSRQAARHVMPKDAPVEVFDNIERDRLVSNPDYAIRKQGGQAPPMRYYSPHSLRELIKVDPRLAGFDEVTILFLGTVRRPDGKPRLVVIAADANLLPAQNRAVVLPVPGLFDPLPKNAAAAAIFPQVSPLHGAYIDPRSASHVIIEPAEPAGVRTDLYLQDDDSFHILIPREPQNQPQREIVPPQIY